METLGKYELLEELGRGGYGTVYRTREPVLDVERAVKVLHPALSSDPEFIERFRREAIFAAQLDHPHIMPVYELDIFEGRYFLVMKYLPGGSLKDVLNKHGKIPYKLALEIFSQIAEGLENAHKKGLIHRDIKPGNILFESDPFEGKVHVRISDFGFAKAMADTGSASLSASGAMLGTPAYMAPEVWKGDGSSKATDVYSLACVFYEMITDNVLFEGKTPPETMTKHMLEGPQFPDKWPQGIPQRVGRVLEKAFEKQPEMRYQSSIELVNALELPEGEVAEPVDKEAVEDALQAELPKAPAGKQGTAEEDKQKEGTPKREKKGGFLAWGWVVGVILLGAAMLLGRQGVGLNAPPEFTATNENIPTNTMFRTDTPALTPTLRVGSTMITEKDGAVMVYVPAGKFEMGSEDGESNESPVHTVWLDEYWIDQTEVTNAMYTQCIEEGACDLPRNDQWCRNYSGDSVYNEHPVVCIYRYEARDYCEWAGKRLPTEAEWENAARGGLEGMKFPWGDEFPVCTKGDVNGAQFNNCGVGTAPVGNFAANGYGLYDMAGNVLEWVSDSYGEDYYSTSPKKNPTGPGRGYSVLRGGSWNQTYYYIRVAHRSNLVASSKYTRNDIGFRCAVSRSP